MLQIIASSYFLYRNDCLLYTLTNWNENVVHDLFGGMIARRMAISFIFRYNTTEGTHYL